MPDQNSLSVDHMGGASEPLREGSRGLLDRVMTAERWVAKVEGWVAIAALLAAILCVFTSILIRTFSLAIPDTGEWAIVAMSPLTFIGGALCSHLHKHLTADIVETLKPGRLRQCLDLIAAVLTFAFGIFFVMIGWDLLDYTLYSGERLTDLGTPVYVPAAFMAAGAALVTFHSAVNIWRALAGREPGGIDPWS
jgi:TRAP-type C4-dicarboxylate transport system permease small subunit